jgi:hypothetical protein
MPMMRPHVRAKVEKNCEYHEALAAQYEQLMHQSAAGNGSRNGSKREQQTGDPKLKYLCELHTEVAKQLREVLGTSAASAIEDALAARTVRRDDRGMIPQPSFAPPPRRAPTRARMH